VSVASTGRGSKLVFCAERRTLIVCAQHRREGIVTSASLAQFFSTLVVQRPPQVNTAGRAFGCTGVRSVEMAAFPGYQTPALPPILQGTFKCRSPAYSVQREDVESRIVGRYFFVIHAVLWTRSWPPFIGATDCSTTAF
jgi:hypothetical protein